MSNNDQKSYNRDKNHKKTPQILKLKNIRNDMKNSTESSSSSSSSLEQTEERKCELEDKPLETTQ